MTVRGAVEWVLPSALRGADTPSTRRARLFAASVVSALGAAVLVLVHRHFDPSVAHLPRIGVWMGLGVILTSLAVVRWRADIDLGAAILLGGAAIFLPVDAVGWGGLRPSGLAALASLPVLASFLLRERATAVIAVTAGLAVVVDSTIRAFPHAEPPTPTLVGRVADTGVCLLLILVMTVLALVHQRERRELHAQVEEREARYAAAIAAEHAGIFEWRAGEGLVGLSPRLKQMFAAPGFPECLDPAARLALERTIEALGTDERASLELRHGHADRGPEWFRVDLLGTAAPVGRAVVGIVRDVTEVHRAARLKDEFVSVVSHELRTPLAAIHGAVTLLGHDAVRRADDPDMVDGLLRIAARNSARLLGLVNDLLDVQRLDTGALPVEMAAHPVLDAVQTTVEALSPLATDRGVRLRVEGTTAAEVHVDPRRLEQVLTNLVGNACKWAPPGSEVRVAVASDADHVRIAVTDAGPGVPESFRDQLFERFSQADTSTERGRGGTGLGLYIARSLTERMGGHIGFEPAEPTGSTFWVVLPTASKRNS